MASIRLANFLGIAPKVSPELLGERFAQIAVNTKLVSGDLIPYRAPKVIGVTARTGTAQTIYPMRDPTNETSNKWLSWNTDVDIAIPTTLAEEEQRIYYTGDGAPKVTDYELAVGDSFGPYPVAAYDLGLPLPTDQPTATATAFSEKTSSTIARDGNNTATLVTSAAHDLITGTRVNVSKFTYRTGTYTRSGNTITVTLNSHGYGVGAQLFLTFENFGGTTGVNLTPVSNVYTIATVATNTFTVEDPTYTGTISGTYDVYIGLYDFNVNDADVTVVNSTTFTYSSVGPATPTLSISTGKINLAGAAQSRKYVYTWLTPWGEESIPSEPSDAVFVREGQVITVGNLPTAKPAGNNNVRGFRLYRTVTGATGTVYLRLKSVYFPNPLASISRTANIATARFQFPHMLLVGDKIKIDGVKINDVVDTSFDVVDGLVLTVVDKFTITYASTGSDTVAPSGDAALLIANETEGFALDFIDNSFALTIDVPNVEGFLYWDIAEPDTSVSRYYETTDFIDDYNVSGLTLGLDTLDADAPDPNMQGLTMAHNNILIGFVQNELCFSEPGRPWSWPIRYRLIFEYQIVAVAAIAGSILVMTTDYPYIVNGQVPANMNSSRIDIPLPCTSKRGVVNMGFSVMYPSWGGIAMYGPDVGAVLVTKALHDWDSWNEAYDPTSMVAKFYNNKYFCAHSTGAFVFERDDQIGGVMVTLPVKFSAAYFDARFNKFYYVSENSDLVYEWDAPDQPLVPLEWKSKVFVNKDYINVGAARIVADYDIASEEALAILNFNQMVVSTNLSLWGYVPELSTLNGPIDFNDPDSGARIEALGTFNSSLLNGDSFMLYPLETAGSYSVNFRLWANKLLVADVVVSNSDIFRLPTGYKTDTLEIAVSGSARIRSIHFGETPAGLVNV